MCFRWWDWVLSAVFLRMDHMFEDGVPGDLDLSSLDGGARVDALCAIARGVAGAQARMLDAMVAVAGTAVGTGFDADEVAFALHLPRLVAQNQVALAVDLTTRLPQVLEALRDGRICLARARVFSDVLIPVADDALARDLADRFLLPAEEWTASQLRSRLTKAVLDADPAAAKTRYERSVEQRRLSLTANDDTTACLSGIFLPAAKVAAGFERVDAIARGLKRDGETRTLDQLRADVFCDLLAGISPASGPVVRAGVVELLVPLTTLIGLSDGSGTLAGYGPVIADIARQVAAQSAEAQAAQTTRATRPGAAVSPDAGLAATAEAAGDVLAPQPPVRWRYRVHDEDGSLLYHGTTRARPTTAAAPLATSTTAATPSAAESPPPEPGGAIWPGVDSDGAISGRPGTLPAAGNLSGLPEISRPPAQLDRGMNTGTDTNTGAGTGTDTNTGTGTGTGDASRTLRPGGKVRGASPSDPAGRPPERAGHAAGQPAASTSRDGQATNTGPAVGQVPRQRTTNAAADEGKTSERIANRGPCPPKQDDDTARFPNARLRSWINARDATCRAPGCTAPARSCDTDHTVDHADGGRTRHDNLGLLCRHHHRLKHEGGFQLQQPRPGHFHWTSPTGRTYETLPEPP